MPIAVLADKLEKCAGDVAQTDMYDSMCCAETAMKSPSLFDYKLLTIFLWHTVCFSDSNILSSVLLIITLKKWGFSIFDKGVM